MRRLALLTAVLALLLAACGGGDADVTTADPTGDWTMIDGTHAGRAFVATDQITLTFATGQVSGRAACNSYFGDVRVDGDRWTTAGLGGTEMGCQEPLMTDEAAFHAAMADVTSYAVTDDELTLTGPDTTMRFSRDAPIEAADLVGTRWVLDSRIEGLGPDGAVSSVQEGGFLLLAGDGRLTGSTGCRAFAGSYVIEGARLRIPDLTADDNTCGPAFDAQNQFVLELLGGQMQAEVVENRLTLTAADEGLGFRAEG